MRSSIITCFMLFCLMSATTCGNDLFGQKVNTGDIIVHAGIGSRTYSKADSTRKSSFIYKLRVGYVGRRYVRDNAYSQWSVMLGYQQFSSDLDSMKTEVMTYYFSPRVDFHFDKFFPKAELYLGFQPNMSVVDFKSDMEDPLPHFNFNISRMLILGISREILKEKGSIYLEAYGIGVSNFGFRYNFSTKKNKPSTDSS